jgi:hypothetical protein
MAELGRGGISHQSWSEIAGYRCRSWRCGRGLCPHTGMIYGKAELARPAPVLWGEGLDDSGWLET